MQQESRRAKLRNAYYFFAGGESQLSLLLRVPNRPLLFKSLRRTYFIVFDCEVPSFVSYVSE